MAKEVGVDLAGSGRRCSADPATRPAGEARLLPRQADLNKTKRSSGEAGFLSLGPPCSPRCTLCNSRWTSQLEACESLTAGWDTFSGALYLLLGLSRAQGSFTWGVGLLDELRFE